MLDRVAFIRGMCVAMPPEGWEPWLAVAMMSPLLLTRHPLKCPWRLGAALANTQLNLSPCALWASGTACRWKSPTTAHVAVAEDRSPTVPGAVGTEHTSAGSVNVTPVTWAPDASARRGRTRAGTRTCAERQKASLYAVDAGSAAATSAPASRVSSEGSTGPSASVTAFPAPGTRASYAQVGLQPPPLLPARPRPGCCVDPDLALFRMVVERVMPVTILGEDQGQALLASGTGWVPTGEI